MRSKNINKIIMEGAIELQNKLRAATLSKGELDMLTWAVDQAEFMRGSMTGNLDPEPLAAYDQCIACCRQILRKLK